MQLYDLTKHISRHCCFNITLYNSINQFSNVVEKSAVVRVL